MIKTASDIIVGHHTEALRCFGPDDPRSLTWSSRESQESRFAVLTQVGDLSGASILDVGCGLGDLWAYLRRRDIPFRDYLGIDINPSMIRAARVKYPQARFSTLDLLDDPVDSDTFDYVMASGIFNIVVPDWEEVTFGTIQRMFGVCRKAVAVNFLSRLSGNSNPAARYALPSEILGFVEENLSSRFTLRHDYRSNDFALFIYKECVL